MSRVEQLFDLSGRVALVTGASSWITGQHFVVDGGQLSK